MGVKQCVNCKREIYSTTRYCVFCGKYQFKTAENSFYSSYFSGSNIFSDDHINLFRNIEVQSFNFPQVSNIRPGQIPNLSGYDTFLAIPNTNKNCFSIVDLASKNKEIGISNTIDGDITAATTPIFDGLFLNFLASNRLFRFRVKRNGLIENITHQLSLEASEDKPANPILISRGSQRVLLILNPKSNKIIWCNISQTDNFYFNMTSLSPLDFNKGEKWSNPIIDDKLEKIYFFSNFGKVDIFKMDDNLMSNPIKESNLDLKNYFPDFIKLKTPPFINNEDIYLFAEIADRISLVISKSKDFNPSKRNLDFPALIDFDDNIIPLHNDYRIFLPELTNKSNIFLINYSGNVSSTNINKVIEPKNSFRKGNNIYSFSKLNNEILIFDGRTITDNIPLSSVIGRNIHPINPVFYLNGVLAMMENNLIHIIKDLK